MNVAGSITMTMRVLCRLKGIQRVVDCNLKPGQAASRLGLTVRQVRRLVRRDEAQGATGLVLRRCNRIGLSKETVRKLMSAAGL